MNLFEKLYKLLKYSNKLNTLQYLDRVEKNNIDFLHKTAKKAYIHGQIGGEHIELSDCKEIYISNFHGEMIGEPFTIPNNTWVIVPFGTGFINYLGKKEKIFFLKNKEKILDQFNNNNGKSISLFNKNFYILKPGDTYCDIEIEIKFDNMIDEGLYEVEHVQKIMNDPFYRNYNFGDVFVNPLREDYLIGFNILPKYKDIMRLYLSKKNFNFNINTLKNEPDTFIKKIINEVGDSMYHVTDFSKNDYLIKNNISRILYPFFVEKTMDIVNKIYIDLNQQIKDFELPVDDLSLDYNNYAKIIINFQEIWSIDELLHMIIDSDKKYNKMIETISTISHVLERNIKEIQNKKLDIKYIDNFNKFKNINDELIKNIKENINYESIFNTIFQQKFNHKSTEKISLIENIITENDNKSYYVIKCDPDDFINIVPIFDLMKSLDVNVKSLVLALYYWTLFHLVFCRILSVMSDITLDFVRSYLMSNKPLYLSDVIKQVNKISDEKKIIFSRSCQGFNSNVSIENAAKCLGHTTEYDLTNVFNQDDGNKITTAIIYIKNNNLDNIFNEDIGDQDTSIYYDLICIFNNKIQKSDIICKIFILFLKKNFIEIYNYFKFNMSIPIPTNEKLSIIIYQLKIVLLILNLFVKSVYDKSDNVHKKNISDIMNS